MPRNSATDVMQDILVAAVLDALAAYKEGAKGVANVLVRDLGAINPNTTHADLPPAVQTALAASVRGAFTRFQKEGYTVAPADSVTPPPRPRPIGQETRRPSSPRPGGGGRPPRGR